MSPLHAAAKDKQEMQLVDLAGETLDKPAVVPPLNTAVSAHVASRSPTLRASPHGPRARRLLDRGHHGYELESLEADFFEGEEGGDSNLPVAEGDNQEGDDLQHTEPACLLFFAGFCCVIPWAASTYFITSRNNFARNLALISVLMFLCTMVLLLFGRHLGQLHPYV
eukprot:TRINITY_DN34010_c0_g1_i1.p1 TRINITY_DN34010_c0_g1~~TRINITY_DN34010_c0_g1_i1.p1  ORF type:complete len:181 (+),score=28.39 TRINITY_DN34010_c0_g1_i1:44-544(+)